jgi:hypothetical protein
MSELLAPRSHADQGPSTDPYLAHSGRLRTFERQTEKMGLTHTSVYSPTSS